MRWVLIATLLLAACDAPDADRSEQTVAAPTPGANSLPSFRFRGLAVGTGLAQAQRSKAVTACYDLGFEMNCSLADPVIAGQSTDRHSVSFKNGRFDGFVLFARPGGYVSMLAALTRSYGPPCKAREENRQADGISVRDQTVRWCFAEGELELQKYYKSDTSTLSFLRGAAAATPSAASL
jgi:hypothetical protein